MRYYLAASIGAVNGLGLGCLLECLRKINNLRTHYESLMNARGESIIVHTGGDPLYWYAIPTIVTIGVSIVSLAIFGIFRSLSRQSLWSWFLVGFASFCIALTSYMLVSSHDLQFFAKRYLYLVQLLAVVSLYEVWFGLILSVGIQRK